MSIGKRKSKDSNYKVSGKLYERLRKSLKVSDETRLKMSKSFKGRKWTDEQNQKRREKLIGRFQSKETREKRSKSNKGKLLGKNKIIIQQDLQGNFIKEWISQREASRITKVGSSHISLCCTNKVKSAGGYIWKFKII